MKTFIFCVLSFFLLIVSGCNSSKDNCFECSPSRLFNIDESQPEFIVSVFGRIMGTPDGIFFDELLQNKLSSGQIDKLTVLSRGTEGGASYCVVVADLPTRRSLLKELQEISTDLKETAYSIASTDSCTE